VPSPSPIFSPTDPFREAAEEFVKGDPFVLNGVIRDWHMREWNEVLAKP